MSVIGSLTDVITGVSVMGRLWMISGCLINHQIPCSPCKSAYMPSTGGDPASATSSDHFGVQTISYKPADIRSHAKRVKQARGSACRYLAAVPELGDGSTSGGTWARKLVDLPVSGRFWNPRARYR